MNVKGTRDYLPEEMASRQRVLDTVRRVYESFGFQPYETPALEAWETLSAKGAGGEDVFKECFNFEDLGKRRIGLRYEITVSLARLMSENPNMPLPFKGYQIGKVWRYGDVAKGRLREFLQADADIVGSESMMADAEVVACAISCLDALGFKDFSVKMNSRKVLNSLLEKSGIDKDKYTTVLRSVDKLDKMGADNVKADLKDKGITDSSITSLFKLISINGPFEKVSKEIESLDGSTELEEIISYLKVLGLDSKVKIDLSLARGLDYYTGPVFEVNGGEGIGSIAGGGRYDGMIGIFSGKQIPAVGISLGIERIMEIIKSKGLLCGSRTKVFVAAAKDEVRNDVMKIAKGLRDKSISADYDLRGRSLSKQMEFADKLGIQYFVVIGPEELKSEKVKIKDMVRRETVDADIGKLAELINSLK